MTTTLIYEPIAHISDDYFWPLKADGSISSRENTNDHGVIETRRLTLNITDDTAIRLGCNFTEANGKEPNNVCNAREITGRS